MDTGIVPSILVVDDDPSLRQLIIDILGDEGGYRVIGVGDAVSSIEALRTSTFDLVLSDLTLMGLDDVSYYDQLVGLSVPGSIRIAFISGVPTSTLEAKGITHYLQKPFEIDDLLSFVACLLRRDKAY